MKHILQFFLILALLTSVMTQHAAWANSAPEEESKSESAPRISLVPIMPLLIPVLKGNRVEKYLILKLSIEAAPETDVEEVTNDIPRVNDAVLREAYLFAKENSGTQNVDMEALRARLLPVIKAILGDKKITGLYITGTDTLKA